MEMYGKPAQKGENDTFHGCYQIVDDHIKLSDPMGLLPQSYESSQTDANRLQMGVCNNRQTVCNRLLTFCDEISISSFLDLAFQAVANIAFSTFSSYLYLIIGDTSETQNFHKTKWLGSSTNFKRSGQSSLLSLCFVLNKP